MEMGVPGRRGMMFPVAEKDVRELIGDVESLIPEGMVRADKPKLPEMSEPEVQRNYLHLSE